MELYIDKKERLFVVDIDPISNETDFGLFSIEDVNQLINNEEDTNEEIPFKIVDDDCGTQIPNQMFYQYPYELRTFEHNDNQFDELLKSLQEQQKKQMKEEKN